MSNTLMPYYSKPRVSDCSGKPAGLTPITIGGRTRICSGKHGAAHDVVGVAELPLRHTPKLN